MRLPAELSAEAVIDRLGLQRHPEGGWYRETWRDVPPAGGRGSGTAILYLLANGERSHWHKVDATEIWHFHAGAPLLLRIAEGTGKAVEYKLGTALDRGQHPQIIVPVNAWQSAQSLGAWTLVGCTVSPAFEFAGFEMAPEGWEPGGV